jgi:hypothetical protein
VARILYVGAKCVLLWMDNTCSNFFKVQTSKTKSYCNINDEVVCMPVRFIECSLPKH